MKKKKGEYNWSRVAYFSCLTMPKNYNYYIDTISYDLLLSLANNNVIVVLFSLSLSISITQMLCCLYTCASKILLLFSFHRIKALHIFCYCSPFYHSHLHHSDCFRFCFYLYFRTFKYKCCKNTCIGAQNTIWCNLSYQQTITQHHHHHIQPSISLRLR